MIKNFLLSLILSLPLNLFSQWGGGEKYPDLKPNQEKLEQFQDIKFGMFVHWGPSAIKGTSSWARGNHPYDFAPRIPINEYDSLYVQFNPVLFNAKDWIQTAKDAGMKYFIMVTKHHDGFCNWDSKYTDYDIMSTPYGKDVLKELSDECKRQGILFGTYYSICDWHHPDYPGRYGGDPRPVESSDMEKFMVFLRNQLDELIEKYQTNILWFDGYWEGPWTHERGMDLYKYLRDKKNDLLINNRVDRMRADKEGKINPWKYAGDFGTPEQEIGTFNVDNPWESCITVSEGWFWRPHGQLKSLKECINILVQTVGGGGNLLLNIGPMPDGRMELFQQKRLKEIGRWLEKYGESIYSTRGGPFKPSEYITSTHKNNKIYLHVLDWVGDTLIIPPLVHKIIDHSVLGGEKADAIFSQDGGVKLSLTENKRNNLNTIIVLKLDGNSSDIKSQNPIHFILPQDYKTITLINPPSKKFNANGPETLIDKKRGMTNFYKDWLGFEGEDLEVVLDLMDKKQVKKVSIGFLQQQKSWIFYPQEIQLSISEDKENFKIIDVEQYTIEESETLEIKNFEYNFKNIDTRYLQIKVKNIKQCPDWHAGAGGKAWLFVDEIIVE